jgi:tetratricopeptide (TPR) repeat protein
VRGNANLAVKYFGDILRKRIFSSIHDQRLFRPASKGNSMTELSDDLHEQIQLLSKEGDNFAKAEDYPAALARYWAAWDLLPVPPTEYEAATWILAAIGDANFLGGDYTAGRDNLSLAMHCPNAIGNPFLHLRLGQCQLELGNQELAADELTRAYMGGGTEIFEGAEKYLKFLKTRLAAPPGGW